MKILKVNPQKPQKLIIKQAVEVLKRGGVLIYPTDTCYGMGADITNPIAVDKIYKIKGREEGKPLSVIVKDFAQIKKMSEVDAKKEKVLKKYLPGPFTFVLLNLDYKTFPQNTVGFRIPKYKITQMIASEIDFPYATTSANLTAKDVCYTVNEIIKQFKNNKYQPNLLLDAGELNKNLPSTVVSMISMPPKILRQGSAKFKA